MPCGDDGNTCTDDVCNGSGTCTHPALAAGTVCRAIASVCDVAETCAGGGASCPADVFLPDTTPCGDLCTTNGSCLAGACTSGTPLECDDHDVCDGLETCDPFTGCVPGTPLECDDGNACTADLCDAIAACSHPALPDDSPCDDGDLCTIIDRCQAGVCEGAALEFVARDSVRIGAQSVVDGRLLVNEPGGFAKLFSYSSMPTGSVVTADRVGLGKATSVFDVETNQLRAPGAVINGTESPASLPVLATWCTPASGTCGGADVVVGERQVVRLAPGAYNTVQILARGTLELDPGQYDFCSIGTTSPTAMRPRGNVAVRVHGPFSIGRFGLFEPYAGTAQLWIAGKAKISTSSEVHSASFNTPETLLKLGRFVRYEGSICADTLRGQRSVQLGCTSP